MKRCAWTGKEQIYTDYHDFEWGVPVHDDRTFFELLILEGAQAGLSWITILKRRQGYLEAFDNFDVNLVAKYGDAKKEELMQNTGIIRNRPKVASSTKNAQAFIEIQKEFCSFDSYIWGFVDNQTVQNNRSGVGNIPARTELSDSISKDLKKRGMSFVGTTIVYAFLQATGIINDHTIDCFRHKELKALEPQSGDSINQL